MDAHVIAAAEFEEADEAAWRRLVDRTLKGADFETTLTTQADDGFRYGPIYEHSLQTFVLGRAEGERPWRIVQRIDDPDVARAIAQAREDIDNGADCLSLVMDGSHSAFGFGLGLPAAPAFHALFDKIDPSGLEIRLEGSLMTARALADCLGRRPIGAVHFGIDPVSSTAFAGRDFAISERIADMVGALVDCGLPGSLLRADGRVAHNAGASEAQELAFVLASLTALARAFETGGMQPEQTLLSTSLAVCVDQQQFISIAKLRALRLLHARLCELCGIASPSPATIHAETSFRMLARRDPETNILRNTIAAFSAGVGGADSIAVLAHTASLGLPDGFARRVARNTQIILLRESHLDVVADPSAGSGGLEALTDALAGAAWTEFQAIEKEGGILQSLSAGHFQRRVADMRERREKSIREGLRPIVGTTLYPSEDRPVTVLETRPEKGRPRGSGRGLEAIPLDLGLDGGAA